MPDTAPIPPIPDVDDDHMLRHLGAEHRVLLDTYRVLCRTQPTRTNRWTASPKP